MTTQRVYEQYRTALQKTHTLIDLPYPRSASRAEAEIRAVERMIRLRALLAALGNPHHDLPIVHIAGTSGKGSTATAIASILTESGYRTGLHTSPYVQAATEKLNLDRTLISGVEFVSLVERTIATASDLADYASTPLTYGELWVAMVFSWFAEAGVDVIVLETGAGGRFDLTNIVSPVLSVITSIGLDHTETLGPTIPDIAWHKAGIIKPGVPVVTAVRDPNALEVIVREAAHQQARLTFPSWVDEQSASSPGNRPTFQRANDALATAAAGELRKTGFTIPNEAIANGLVNARIPGRAEMVQAGPLVLLDGAHNPQKVQALAENLPLLAPVETGGARTVIFGSLDAKNHQEMLSRLLPFTNRLILTAPEVYGKQSSDPHALAREANALGFAGAIEVFLDAKEAMTHALSTTGEADAIVVTGSIYLVGNVRERWYPARQIVLQQTAWPDATDGVGSAPVTTPGAILNARESLL